jgi:hypothetical protein
MLINKHELNPYKVSYEMEPDTYAAVAAGELALLGANHLGRSPEALSESVAEVLLSTPSSVIMHFGEPVDTGNSKVGFRSQYLMMAANYHRGHSEGLHKIIVQNPDKPEEGQWILWTPPGSNNKTFYRRASLANTPYGFEERATNSGKINEFFVHTGAADEAIGSFEDLGYTFSDEYLLVGDPTYRELSSLSSAAGGRWDPFADK